MMKKITRIAALLAATALLFGAIGCSDEDDGDDPTLENIAISIDEKAVKTEYAVNEPIDLAGITVTATYSDDSTKDVTADATFTATTADGKFTTAKAGEYDVTLTATYGEITSEPVSCKITVGGDTVSPVSFELTSGAAASEHRFTLTLGTTQFNEAGLAALKAIELSDKDAIATIVQQTGSNISVSKIAITEDATATTLKVSLTMASDATAGTEGTITLTLPGEFTENSQAIAKTIPYTINGSTTTPPDGGTPATAKTYKFTGEESGIVAADISDWDLSAKDVINAPISKELTTKALANGASISWKGSKVGTLRLRASHEANSGTISDLAPTITALNYNGGADSDISNGIAIADLDRYVSIPVDGAGTVSAEVTFKGAKDTDNPTGGPFQVAFVDADGKLLGTVVTDGLTASSTKTVSGTVTAAGTVYLAFSRNGAKKGSSGTGGIDVSTITVAPAAD